MVIMKRFGFTLIELLLVIGIIGILSAIVLIAINPTKQLRDARGVNRNAATREIENAVSQYIIDGNSFSNIPALKSSAKDICRGTVTGSSCTDNPVSGYDLSALVPNYLVGIPVDPDETDENITGYRIYQDGSFTEICAVRDDSACGS